MTQNKRKRDIRKPPGNAPRADSEISEEHAAKGRAAGKNEQAAHKPPFRQVRWTSFELGSFIIQSLTLVSLVAYTGFTYKMWQGMDKSARREESFFRLAHRARLGSVLVDKFDIKPNVVYEVKATYRNDPASLPAENVIARAQIWVVRRDEKLPSTLMFFPPVLREQPVTVVAPGGGAFVPAIWGTNESGLTAIQQGRDRMYFYGSITYTDAFKTDGVLEFCYFYWPPAKDWRFCDSHNAAR